MNSNQAVFLHSGYGATDHWLWSCIRDLNGVAAYTEPLREIPVSFEDEVHVCNGVRGTSHGIRMRHASGSHFRRLEVPEKSHFELRFSASQFDDAAPEEASNIEYSLRTLMAQAFEQECIPVFRFDGSLGRLAWLRRAFPDVVHIVVARNPRSQWLSSFARFNTQGDVRSVALPFLALACSRNVPAVERVIAGLQIDLSENESRIADRSIDQCFEFFKEHVAYVGPALSYRAFLGCWLLSMRNATTYADAIFDCDLAMRSPTYLCAAEDWIRNLTGLAPSMRTAHRNKVNRGHVPIAIDEGDLHLAAMEVGKSLVREGTAPVEALALWASKLAEAALGARSERCVDEATRILDLAAAGSFGCDTVLASELALMKEALSGITDQGLDFRPSPWSRLTTSARNLLSSRCW